MPLRLKEGKHCVSPVIRRFLELESSLRPFRSIVYITYSQIDEYVLCIEPLLYQYIDYKRETKIRNGVTSAATETLIETPLKPVKLILET